MNLLMFWSVWMTGVGTPVTIPKFIRFTGELVTYATMTGESISDASASGEELGSAELEGDDFLE